MPRHHAQTAFLCHAMAVASLVGFPSLAAQPTTLKAAYGQLFAIGASIPPGPELTPAEQSLLVTQFTNVTSENCLKPQATEPQEDVYTFQPGDALVDFAQRHGLTVNGHCLVWGEATPDWFFQDHGRPAARALVLKRMTGHITTEMSRYRGRVFSWDVVNEAIADDKDVYLKPNRWQKSIGDDYVAQAFRAAAQADPQADLYYNDYNIESPVKRAKALRLIRDLKKQGVRVDGIGIQGHWRFDSIPYRDIDEAIAAFHGEGLKVMITELDLDMVPHQTKDASGRWIDPYPSGLPADLLQRQADQYAKLFALFRRHAAEISRVTFWNIDDARSWLNEYPHQRTNYPLLWDRQAQPKPALAAVLAESQRDLK